MKKRLHSKRDIKIKAYQRAVRMLDLLNHTDIYFPALADDDYPYKTELRLEVTYLQNELRDRIYKLAEKEYPNMDPQVSAYIF